MGTLLMTHMVLVKDNRPLRVQTYREQRRKHFPSCNSERFRVLWQGQSVPSDDRVQ